ncbi:MAG: flagellar type III secretion system protein FliR [Deltaproteobacteria bacterium]|nr:flagellar type III secretion system protein FliR [Deltaproteobacteria bacterium]
MAYFNVSLAEVQTFLLIFLRVGAILLTLPIFSSRGVPPLFKIGLSFAMSLLLYPILNLSQFPVQLGIIPLGLGIISEIILGVIIGLSVRMVFAGVQLAGQLVGFQMGLAMANIVDPATSEQLPLLGELNNIIALLIFLTINAHHWFLRAVADSFRLVPPFAFHFSNSLMDQLVALGGNMFVIAIKVGAPVIAALFLMSVAFGVAARTVPQMNIFFVAMPVKILVGLLFLGFSFPYLSSFMKVVFTGLEKTLFYLLKAM